MHPVKVSGEKGVFFNNIQTGGGGRVAPLLLIEGVSTVTNLRENEGDA